MELRFKQSNLGNCQIVETSDGQKYIMDTSTLVGKGYYWGFLKDKLTVEMYGIGHDNNLFTSNKVSNFSLSVVVIMLQPLVKICYDVLYNYFVNYGISHQIILKIALFLFSSFLSYIVVVFQLVFARKNLANRLENNTPKYILTFRTNKKRNYEWCFVTILNIICLTFYMFTTNGTEGVFLVINGIITYFSLFLLLVMTGVATPYRNGQFIVESIQKV